MALVPTPVRLGIGLSRLLRRLELAPVSRTGLGSVPNVLLLSRSLWEDLQEQIAARTKRLASAAEIHRFNRDLNELIARIQEKDAALSLEDLGRDLASVQALQRKHEGFERDLLALEPQLKALTSEATRLQAAYQGC